MNYYVFFTFLIFISDVLIPQAIANEEVAIANNRADQRIYKRRTHYSDWTAYTAAKKNTYGHKGMYNHSGKVKGQTNPGSLAWDLG
jgi:hypothetical protein